MSDERKWASWEELGRGSLSNYDQYRQLTIYQFVAIYDGECFDKYIQAHSIGEAQEIFLNQVEEDELDLAKFSVYSVCIPANDVLDQLTRKTKIKL